VRVEDFDFELPAGQIAQHPLAERGSSRLMIVDRAAGTVRHETFATFLASMRTGDLVVRNDTRVLAARLRGSRKGGGEVEVLLLEPETPNGGEEIWKCLAKPGRRLRAGETAELRGGIIARWLDEPDDCGIRRVALRAPRPIVEMLGEVGEVPLPPYIDRPASAADRESYQTVYASNPGAVAAPTAGLHFTPAMLDRLTEKGVRVASLTLHVGPATFLPVRVDRVEDHRLGSERIEVPAPTLRAVREAKREGRRVIAIGTTTVRALEGIADRLHDAEIRDRVALFIVPGYRFRVVDAMLTNFHLPRSTLLMLVCAFAGKDLVLAAYRDAVARGYRFYSYGDAMLLL